MMLKLLVLLSLFANYGNCQISPALRGRSKHNSSSFDCFLKNNDDCQSEKKCSWCEFENDKISVCVPESEAIRLPSTFAKCEVDSADSGDEVGDWQDDLKKCLAKPAEKICSRTEGCEWCDYAESDEFDACVPDWLAEKAPTKFWSCGGKETSDADEDNLDLEGDIGTCMVKSTESTCSTTEGCVWCKDKEFDKFDVCSPDWLAEKAPVSIWACGGKDNGDADEDNLDLVEGDSGDEVGDWQDDLKKCLAKPAEKICSRTEGCEWCDYTKSDELDVCVPDWLAEKAPASIWSCGGKDTIDAYEDNLDLEGDLGTCMVQSTESTCSSTEGCVWCKDKEFGKFDVCSPDWIAEKAPVSIWACGGEDSLEEDKSDLEENFSLKSFNFEPGKIHTLRDAPVNSEFCDPESPRSLSGYFGVNGSKYDAKGEDKNLFFWFFERRRQKLETPPTKDKSEIPIIVWLTGGPGCSSILALLLENGPCAVNEDGTGTILNNNSWNEVAHMLWLDQPAGVGYSYGKSTDSNEDEVGEDSYYFLQSFFQAHPEYVDNPLYVVGESYGGHYAPAIAHRIFLGNNEAKEGTIALNLSGLAVGNGLTKPIVQYKYYAEMAYENSHNIKTVSEDVYQAMQKATPQCIDYIKRCDDATWAISKNLFCRLAVSYCNLSLVEPYSATGLNVYDIRKKCDNPPLCYDLSSINKFLNLQSTKDALHVSSHIKLWEACNTGINIKFMLDWMIDFSPYVADLLNAGIPTLIYAGDVDYICNYLGNQAWTLDLDWDFKEQFNDATVHDWKGKGSARSSNGFTFMQIYDAGHMVPKDQPEVALDMIQNFISGDEF